MAEREGVWEDEGEGKKNRNKNQRQSKGGKEGGKTHMTTVRDPLVPLIDFVAMEKNTMGERNGNSVKHILYQPT